jgi:nucleotide-binding universal stress UspA family protein
MHRQEEQMPAEIQNFLVATDGSESAGRAVDVAAAMTKAAHGTLKILTVGESQTALQQTDFMPAEGKKANLTDFWRKRNNEPAGLA